MYGAAFLFFFTDALYEIHSAFYAAAQMVIKYGDFFALFSLPALFFL